MSYHIGQKVVCINASFSNDPDWRIHVHTFPVLRGIYTIREIFTEGDVCGFCFDEVRNPRARFTNGFVEPAFNCRNFRPLVEKKTDIGIFVKMLDPVRRREIA